MSFIEKLVVVGPFQCNCRVVACPETGDAVVIDPGDEADKIIQKIEETKTPDGKPIQVKALFHTHAHLDHVGGTKDVRERLPDSKIYLHKEDLFIYQMLSTQSQMFGLNYGNPLPVERNYEHEEELQ